MELDKQAQEAVRSLGAIINRAIEKSFEVAAAIENLRELGYEPNLTLKLEIALQQIGAPPLPIDDFSEEDDIEDIELELTDEDVRTLRRMKIKIDG